MHRALLLPLVHLNYSFYPSSCNSSVISLGNLPDYFNSTGSSYAVLKYSWEKTLSYPCLLQLLDFKKSK